MTIASVVRFTTTWAVLAALSTIGLLVQRDEPADVAPERVESFTRVGLDLQPFDHLDISNRWGNTRVVHEDRTRMSITSSLVRDDSPLAHFVAGPTEAGLQFTITPIGDPRGETIDLEARVPRGMTVTVRNW